MQYENSGINVESDQKLSKVATYNFMTFNPQNGWQFTFFEHSLIDYKNTSVVKGIAQAVPVIRDFFPIFANNTNARIGTNIAYENPKIGIFYTQFAYSCLRNQINAPTDANLKLCDHVFDFQIGYKNHNFLNVKNLNLLAEFNINTSTANTETSQKLTFNQEVDAYLYSNYNSNFGQSLTLPKNDNSLSLVCIISYQIKQFKIMAKYSLAKGKYDKSYNIASIPGYVFYPQQCVDFQFVYEMNPVSKMQWFVGGTYFKNAVNANDYYISIGFRTALRNNFNY